jgi:hypothetical protein
MNWNRSSRPPPKPFQKPLLKNDEDIAVSGTYKAVKPKTLRESTAAEEKERKARERELRLQHEDEWRPLGKPQCRVT